MRILFNFRRWSCIIPTNFDTCLQVLLNFLWLSHISLLTFVSQNFVGCLQILFNFRWWSCIVPAKLCYILASNTQLSLLHTCEYYPTFFVCLELLLQTLLGACEYSQLSLAVLYFSYAFCITKLCFMLTITFHFRWRSWIAPLNFARCLQVSLNFLWWSWIAPANFATRLRVLPNFLCLSWIAPLNFARCLRVSLNFLWWSWIAPANFATRLRVLPNFLCLSWIAPLNFDACLQVLLNFLWLSHISLLTFVSQNFVGCLQILFNFR